MQFNDRAPVTGIHRTANGYLAADVKISRTGVQTYSGHELGRPEMREVRIYRPAEQVFSHAAMASAAHKPITVDHPPGTVDATNWKSHSVGWSGADVARDGEFLRVSMLVADAAAIASIENGTRELSCGYSSSLRWDSGRTESGEAYDAVMGDLKINHIAIVPKGRAGSECRIGDSEMNHNYSTLDAQTATQNILRTLQGGGAISVSDGVRRVSEEVARDAAEKTARNNAYVDALVADRRRQTDAMIGRTSPAASAITDAANDAGKAMRDLARLSAWS